MKKALKISAFFYILIVGCLSETFLFGSLNLPIMTEAYLQNIWANKRIPFSNLKLTDGREIIIHNVGAYNQQLSGPDFSLGSVRIDGVKFIGNIEIHVKASDWYRHNHQKDSAYNSVILHVVYENDLDVIQNGYTLPSLELKDHIDQEHFEKYLENKIRCEDFPCRGLLDTIDSIYLESMKSKAIHRKLMEKTKIIMESGLKDEFAVFYYLLGNAFGTSINKLAFENLVRKIPFESLRLLPAHQKYQLLITESGILQNERKHNVSSEHWHFRGTRPSNFPTLRVRQFSFFASRFDFDTSFRFLDPEAIVNYFQSTIREVWVEHGQTVPVLSRSFENLLIINGLVPFLWYYAEKSENYSFRDKALDVLQILPPEKNAVLRKWTQLGIANRSAYDSQALLALHRYFCCHKKCLSCEVGNKILNRSV